MIQRYTDADVEALVASRPRVTEDGLPQCLPRRTEYGSAEAAEHGLIPVADFPDMIPKPADYQGIIEACIKAKTFPEFHYYDAFGPSFKWNQDGWGYCWTYSLTMSTMICRQAEGFPHVLLSPFSLSWLVNGRNQGYYLDAAIKGAKERGLAPLDMVPEFTTSESKRKAGWQQEALKYRPSEWWDCSPSNMTGHCLAVLATGRPLYMAYNWWAHALCIVGMRWENGGIVWRIRNSHNEDDLIEGQGSKWEPDEAYGVRATSFSA